MNGYAVFKTTASEEGDPELYERSGQTVAICRELVDGREYDKAEIGLMYLVEFIDGYRGEVFADELTPTDEGWDESLRDGYPSGTVDDEEMYPTGGKWQGEQ